jgi:hypothetical protein
MTRRYIPEEDKPQLKPCENLKKNPAMFGVIRENHEKRVKKGGVLGRVGAHGAVCINKEETP